MTRTQRWTLAVVCAATAMLMLDIAVVNTALSDIAADLDTGLSGLQWVVDAYTLALAATVLTAGSLADRIGRRRLFLVGLAVFTVTSGLCAAATDITMLNLSRAAQGLGASIMFAVSLAVLSHAFPKPGERAKALAAYGASIGAAFAIGPAVGGALTSGLDWRWIFLVNIPFGLACLAITQRFVVESRDPHARRIDWSGQALLIVGLFVLVLALLRGNEDGWGSPLIVTLLAGSVASLVAFVVVERRSPHAMLPLALFRNPDFTGAQVAAFAISATFFAVFIYMTLYLQQILGLSAIEAGLVYLPGTIVMFFVSGATAALGEKVSARAMIVTGLVLVAAGMGWIAMVAEVGSSWTSFLPGSIVAMIGSGLFNPALSAVALGSVPTEQSGLAAGVNDTFRQAGIAVGVAALGALVPAAAAFGDGSPQSYVDGMNDALWVCVVACLAGAAASALLIRGRRPAPAPVVRPELALDAA